MKYCLNCGAELRQREKEKKFWFLKRQFCNRSCSAIYTNKQFPKRKYEGKACKCGKKINNNSKTCHNCKIIKTSNDYGNRLLKNCIGKGNARVKFSAIRAHARRLLELNNINKKCKYCNFNYVDVCHIVPLSSYSESSLVKDFNNLENLIYLCPNHHTLLDRGELIL